MIMTRGKSICSVLKTIRKQIADANGIKYEPHECHHQGECRGTCPACEAEVRYIERQLDIRQQLGKAAVVVGISAGLSALTACGSKSKKVEEQELVSLAEGRVRVESPVHLDGDVEYQSPVDSTIIEKAPETIKKRTAPFKSPMKEKQEWTAPEVTSGMVDIIEVPEPPAAGEAPYAPQGSEQNESNIFYPVEVMPSFPGGSEALMNYLAENITYPKECEDVCVQGRVIISFIVEKDGSISDAKVVKSVYKPFDEEALRVVNGMPKWIPGMMNGKPTRVKYTIPVSFKLQ